MEFKLIIKKLNNTLSPKEKVIFSNWYNESAKHRDFFNSVKNNYNQELNDVDVEKAWLKIQNNLKEPTQKRYYWGYAAAAVLVGAISIAYFLKDSFSFTSSEKEPEPVIMANTPISPGTDKATLTLSDGSSVVLEKGNAYQEGNVSSNGEEIVYNPSGESTGHIAYNYLTIPRGGQFYVKLSDGTEVWLNSESQLKYPTSFVKGQLRQVELVYGEAYFDVSPSKQHGGSKFKVLNQAQEIEVIGTEFNIKAYKDELDIYTTLVEGKVAVSANNSSRVLKPNQQSKLNKENHTITVANVDVYNEISWKDGVFSFREKPLKEIMKIISRWYDVDVVFENKELESLKFKGTLDKQQSVEEILSIMKSTTINNYKIENNVILLN